MIIFHHRGDRCINYPVVAGTPFLSADATIFYSLVAIGSILLNITLQYPGRQPHMHSFKLADQYSEISSTIISGGVDMQDAHKHSASLYGFFLILAIGYDAPS